MPADVVALSVQNGSNGYTIARRVAEALRFRYYDWEITLEAARIAGVPPAEVAAAERVRALRCAGEVGVSAWNGLAVARLCAKDGAELRGDLAAVVAALGGELPRLWVN